jgi:hypothetical protein
MSKKRRKNSKPRKYTIGSLVRRLGTVGAILTDLTEFVYKHGDEASSVRFHTAASFILGATGLLTDDDEAVRDALVMITFNLIELGIMPMPSELASLSNRANQSKSDSELN